MPNKSFKQLAQSVVKKHSNLDELFTRVDDLFSFVLIRPFEINDLIMQLKIIGGEDFSQFIWLCLNKYTIYNVEDLKKHKINPSLEEHIIFIITKYKKQYSTMLDTSMNPKGWSSVSQRISKVGPDTFMMEYTIITNDQNELTIRDNVASIALLIDSILDGLFNSIDVIKYDEDDKQLISSLKGKIIDLEEKISHINKTKIEGE